MLAIINVAAEVYRGVTPADRWRSPYTPAEELAAETADGVSFSGYGVDGSLVGVMVDPTSISSATPTSIPDGKGTVSARASSGIYAGMPKGRSSSDLGGGVGDPLLRAPRLRASPMTL